MKNIKKIGIIVACFILVIICFITGYLVKMRQEENKTTGTEWGDLYIENISKRINEEIKDEETGIKNAITPINVRYIENKGKNPVMVLDYSVNKTDTYNGGMVEIDYITEDNKVKFYRFYEGKSQKDINIKYMYNIEKDEYDWYIAITNGDIYNEDKYISKTYEPLSVFIEAQRKITSANNTDDENMYLQVTKEMQEYENNNKYIFKYGEDDKFNKEFIELDESINYDSKYSFNIDMSIKELIKLTREYIQKQYKTDDQLVTDEVQEKVKTESAEIKTKLEEETKKVEEEKAAKEAEEDIKGLKVGKYTLKYGTYKGSGKNYNSGENYTCTFILNSDGTCTYTRITGETTEKYSGKYEVTRDSWYGIEYTGESAAFDGIKTKWSNGNGELFAVGNDTISDMEMTMKYVGN